MYRSNTGYAATRKINYAPSDRQPFNENHVHIDTRLNDWLCKNNIDENSKNAIHGEEFSYEDFVYEMTQSEMHRIGLK